MSGKEAVLGGRNGAVAGSVGRTGARMRARRGAGATVQSVVRWWVRSVAYFGASLVSR
jgi:hypothetical protein